MAMTPKEFQTLVPLQQQEGMAFQLRDSRTRLPKWFQTEYLRSPKSVHLEAWLVEKIFGRGGELIPHSEGVTRTLLHVNRWEPGGEAEILIFGRPSYQLDVSQMILNLAEHFRQLRQPTPERSSAQEVRTQRSAPGDGEAQSPQSPGLAPEAEAQGPPEAAEGRVVRL